ncbi:AhpC-TSA-domain-containing protein [Xylariomycetidae sp. FL2044]|nr:AhpC-TSA-domain-containing protein [Xylariomycetidae sp. FL2044]
MSQAEQLSAIARGFAAQSPEIFQQLADGHAEFLRTFSASQTIQPGARLPSFTMTDATGEPVSSDALLLSHPQHRFLLLTFYRGNWCPYCNVALAHLRRRLADFEARGCGLVAVSPELPDTSLSTVEKLGLQDAFPVLTDRGNALAAKLGLLYDQGSARALHASVGVDLKERNGDDSWVVPIPASILVDREGVVRNVWVEPDYKKRLDPEVALGWVDALLAGETK